MGLGPKKTKKNWTGVLNYAQIALSIFAAANFPGWVTGGYLSDCMFNIGSFCFPVFIPVAIATFGSLIAGIWWTVSRYKKTGSWF